MENVDYVARAKNLMMRTARTAALVIVPLAAASNFAVNAAAVLPAVLPTDNFSCSASDNGGSVSCPSGAGASQLPDPGNGIQGVKLFTSGGIQFFSGGSGSLLLSTSGTAFGPNILTGTVIPLSYNFTIDTNGPAFIGTWTLTYTLISGPTVYGTQQFSGSGSGTFTSQPTQTLTTTADASGEALSTVNLSLDFNWFNSGGGSVTVTVPANSFDVNAVDAPEPASLGLLATGLALLGWRILRDRQRRWGLCRIRG